MTKTKLIQDYLSVCDFYGVSSEYCKNKFGLGDVSNPEIGKEKALKAFTKKVNQFGEKIGAKSVSLGFSDDDVKTVNHIEKFFKDELSLEFPIKYNVYNTSVRGNKGIRTKINHQEEVLETQNNFGSGMGDSSVMPFSKWNNMTQNLYPSGKDFSNDDFHNQFKNQIGQIKDLTNDVKKKPMRVKKFENFAIENERKEINESSVSSVKLNSGEILQVGDTIKVKENNSKKNINLTVDELNFVDGWISIKTRVGIIGEDRIVEIL